MKRVDGKKGEDIALEYLLKRGFVLRDRNWRCHHLEIDLVMEDEKYLHIVEVRSRREPYLVSPIDSVIKKKQNRIVKACSAYIKKFNILKEVSFDVVSITFFSEANRGYKVEFYERAFYPIYR